MIQTLSQKIGQTLMIGFDGTTLTSDLREMIERYHVGGVILFARNVQSPSQVAQLTSDIQHVAQDAGLPGLFVAIDQEGGRVARLTQATGFTEFPSAMAVAATGDAQSAYLIGRAMAGEMRAVGINVDFAPDLDVNNNPANPIIGTRSYGSEPAQVAEYGVATIRGLQAGNLLAFGKHFPGHGDTDTDSHLALPNVPHGRARLDETELLPFRAAIAASVAGIMSAHVTFPAIESRPDVPATLSPAALTELLRGELGFDGLIVTDSLEMGALATLGYSPAQAAAGALHAGADILLFNRGHSDHRAAHALIAEKIASGDIPIERLEAAVARILQAKTDYGLLDPAPLDRANLDILVGTEAHWHFARTMAQRSYTLLRDDAAYLPIAKNTAVLVETSGVGLGAVLGLPTISLDAEPTGAQIAEAETASQAGKTLVIGLNAINQKPKQQALFEHLLADGAKLILVALRDPYDLLAFPQASAMLATYAAAPALLHGLGDLLFGRTQPHGRLPVELPGMFSRGAGMTNTTITP